MLLQTAKDPGVLPNMGSESSKDTCCPGHLISIGKLGHTSKDRILPSSKGLQVKMISGAGRTVLYELYLTTTQT